MDNALRRIAVSALHGIEGLVVRLANRRRTAPRRYLDYQTWDLLKAHRIAEHLQDGDAVLDIGCGNGHVLDELGMFRRLRRVGIDLAPQQQRPGVAIAAFDGRTVPFADGEFDVTLLCYVLHHLEPARARHMIEEALRVSRRSVLLLEDSLPRFGALYRLRNKLHRISSDLSYRGASQTYRSPGGESMFLTHAGWRDFVASISDRLEVSVQPLGELCRYGHHALVTIDRPAAR